MNITGKGQNFKEWREALGMDQDDVAVILNCHQATVANYENNRSPITLKVLKVVEKISGSDQYLIGKKVPLFKSDEVMENGFHTTINLLTKGPEYRKEFLYGS